MKKLKIRKVKYNRFTYGQRQLIEIYLARNYSLVQIAQAINRNQSSVYREIKRNSSPKEKYNAIKANQRALELKNKRKPKKLTLEMKSHIHDKVIQCRWSPQKIRKEARKSGIDMVSIHRIYHYIKEDKEYGGSLHKHLKIGLRRD
ncbi:MAG: helix-turn-helix domain-containing protein [Flavobacteriaceae bacterium]|nr:helix-turn-helix domain-containing protein [Flavobacteriaceae bacterium]